jgi:predicted lipoprotein with Yx(FWY)xxD motif
VAGQGVRADLLGTTRRRDGSRQLTYRGRPVYYYVADSPGRMLCQDVTEFGGRWLVIRPDGTPVR